MRCGPIECIKHPVFNIHQIFCGVVYLFNMAIDPISMRGCSQLSPDRELSGSDSSQLIVVPIATRRRANIVVLKDGRGMGF